MKASEYIQALQKLIDEHGDLEMKTIDSDGTLFDQEGPIMIKEGRVIDEPRRTRHFRERDKYLLEIGSVIVDQGEI